jgi:SAM-dependent methyltransferase
VSREYDPERYWSGLLEADFSIRGVAHPTLAVRFNRLLYRSLRSSVGRALRAHDLGGASVFDVGIGTGIWLDFWREQGATRLAGIDLSGRAVADAARRYPDGAFVRGDVAVAVPRGETYDLVSAMNVLLHVVGDEPFERALANIRSLLRPGGLLVAIEPLACHHSWLPPHDSTSTSRARTYTEWRTALTRNGLRPAAVRPATCVLGNPVDARTATAYRRWMRLWERSTEWIDGDDRRAFLLGLPLYAADAVLTRAFRAGPSAKVALAVAA